MRTHDLLPAVLTIGLLISGCAPQDAGQAHGIRGHWNSVHRMLNELAWFDEWMK